MTTPATMPRLLRYATVGAVATAVHYLLLAACVELGGWPAFLASGFGAVVGAQVAYVLGRSWLRFQGTAIVGALFGMAVVALAVHLGWHYLLAQVLATALALLLTFAINRRWTFG